MAPKVFFQRGICKEGYFGPKVKFLRVQFSLNFLGHTGAGLPTRRLSPSTPMVVLIVLGIETCVARTSSSSFGGEAGDYKFSPFTAILSKLGYLVFLEHAFVVSYSNC